MNRKKILYVASEVEPFAKTGGLADVAGSLPKALNKFGEDARVVMPKYSGIPGIFKEKMEYVGYIYVDVSWRHQYCGIFKLEHEGMTVYFLDNEYYFGRDGLYGHLDDAERFVFFSKAVLQMLPVVNFKPDIINTNDWQSSVISMLLKVGYNNDEYYKDIKTVFTIHNLKYQGVFPKEVLAELLGISWEHFKSDGIEFFDKVNFMKAGIVYSDLITTVSSTYSEEIKTDFFGEQLNDALNSRADSLYGIVNGIDNESNDPSTDKRLFAQYDPENLDDKLTNKHMLQEYTGLKVRHDIPLIGIISRLVDQKGFDLIAYVIEEMMGLEAQYIVLGAGEQRYEDMFRWAAGRYPDKISVNLKYDPVLAQRIYAGSDMILMPSLFEPCGLSQLFGLRYGSIPIVRETGGLKDTIQQYNELTGEGNGFTFARYNAHEMLYSIRQAIHLFYHKATWDRLIRRGMRQDFSWGRSAGEYREVYRKLLQR